MKKIKVLGIVLIMLYSFSNLIAQEGFDDFEKQYFKKEASEKQKTFVDGITIPKNIKLPKLDKEFDNYGNKLSWDAYFKKSFASWFVQPKSYNYNKSVAIAYGIFGLANFETRFYIENLKNNLNDTIWMEQTYKEMKPVLIQAWPLLDDSTRTIYIELIRDVEVYMKNFDYGKEKNYLENLKKFNQEYKFTSTRLFEEDYYVFRKADAFIFRRINDSKKGLGNWSEYWVAKMIKDLKKTFKIK
jgi:hypothetical protein